MTLSRLPRLSRSFLCVLSLLAAPAALAGPIVVDLKIGEAMLANSGDATELAALRAITGIGTLQLSSKFDVTGNHVALPVSGMASTWMLSDATQPGYFALKFGIGKLDVPADTFFFQNIGDLSQLVWTDAQVRYLSGGPCDVKLDKCNIGRLSHYIAAPAPTAPAPVPTQNEGGAGSGTQTGGGAAGEPVDGGGLVDGSLTGGTQTGGGQTDGGLLDGGLTPGSMNGGGMSGGGLQTGAQQDGDVPEPGSLALLAMGALAVYGGRRRNTRGLPA